MNKTTEFISEFGEELFNELFECVHDDKKSTRVTLLEVTNTSAFNIKGTADVYRVEDVNHHESIEVQFVSGDYDGSQIIDYGSGLESEPNTATTSKFVLDTGRISAQDLPLMQAKYNAKIEEIQTKEKEYNYDMYVTSGSLKTTEYYNQYLRSNYLKIEVVTVNIL